MPKTTRSGEPRRGELPGTIERSPRKAQETYAKAHDSAAEQYGDEERAHRVAYAALKHTFQKVGDHWEEKGRKGPSDPRAADPRAREDHGRTFGGVDYFGSSKKELLERAATLGIRGRSPRRNWPTPSPVSRADVGRFSPLLAQRSGVRDPLLQ